MTVTVADYNKFTKLNSLGESFLERLASLSTTKSFSKGELLIQEGKEAKTFILISKGKANVLTEIMDIPSGGYQEKVAIQTLGEGELVGWSWIIPPHQWRFDVEAITEVEAIIVNGSALKEEMGKDPEFGYQLLKIFMAMCCQRLSATRMKLAIPGSKPFTTVEGG